MWMTPAEQLRPANIEQRTVAILGTGHALPEAVLTSTAIDARLGQAPGTTERQCGVRQRHVAARQDNAATLAAQAARRALDAAGLTLADIDCLISANGTADQGLPNNAALVHRELGLSALGTPAWDVNASCLSFLAAVDTLAWPIAAGRYQRVLIVSSDIASCGLDWTRLEASAIFGDGAAAAVLGPSQGDTQGSRILAAELRTFSAGAELCQIPAGGSRFHPTRIGHQAFDPLTRFQMDGKAVFKLAAAELPGFVERLLARAGLRSAAELDWIVPHQASHLALGHLGKRLGFAREKLINIFADHGNQIAASLPTALDIAVRDGRIRRGQTVLLLGTGAGLSIGGMVLKF